MSVNLDKDKIFPPSEEFATQSRIKRQQDFDRMYRSSIDEPEKFWGEIAAQFSWHKKWDRVCNLDNKPFIHWFEGAKLNITENCIDRHLKSERKDKTAIIWEGEPGDKRTLTYSELSQEVARFANVLKSLQVKKGDRVIIYLPMIVELAIAALACARIGAIHSVVFAGFSAASLAERITDCGAKVVITVDGSFRRGKVLPLKDVVDQALEQAEPIENCIVIKRAQCQHKMKSGRDHYYETLVQGVASHCDAEVMDANDPLFILYTSGSTGKPKGIVHNTAGYMVGTATTTKYVFDIQEQDIYWCTADIGWITGHSYLLYGPLLNGMTTLMYEGAPNYPQQDRIWDIIEKYQVSVFYTAPTLIRAAIKWGDDWVKKHDLSSLRLLGSVGEPIHPTDWMWYYTMVGQQKCPIVDTWWQTETGAIMLSPIPGITHLKPGSATIPFLGVDAAIVDEDGQEVEDGQGGILVIKQPWPSMLANIWNDSKRYQQVYWERFKAQGYYLAGDGALRDSDGYFFILGRIDDVINVSGHRLSTMELEGVLVKHENVVEAAVVGYPHEVKGEAIAAYVTLVSGIKQTDNEIKNLESHLVNHIGAFARPDQIHFVEALPKTRSGKIMRRLLRDIAAGKTISGDLSTIEDKAALEALAASQAKGASAKKLG